MNSGITGDTALGLMFAAAAVPGAGAEPSHVLAGLSPPLLVTNEASILPLLGDLARDPLATWRNKILPVDALLSQDAQQQVDASPALSSEAMQGAAAGPSRPTRKRKERATEEPMRNLYNQPKHQMLHLEEEVGMFVSSVEINKFTAMIEEIRTHYNC